MAVVVGCEVLTTRVEADDADADVGGGDDDEGKQVTMNNLCEMQSQASTPHVKFNSTGENCYS